MIQIPHTNYYELFQGYRKQKKEFRFKHLVNERKFV